jgi:hypothetical protein
VIYLDFAFAGMTFDKGARKVCDTVWLAWCKKKPRKRMSSGAEVVEFEFDLVRT